MPGGVGGTVRTPLCADRTSSPKGLSLLAPEGWGAATPSAGGADQSGICAPVSTTGAESRATPSGPLPVAAAAGEANAGDAATAARPAAQASRRERNDSPGKRETGR